MLLCSSKMATIGRSTKTNKVKKRKSKSILTGKTTASYDFKFNQDKDNFNHLCSKAMFRQGSKSALIVDGIQLRTTKACENAGIDRYCITSIERNRKVHNLHTEAAGIHSFHGEVWKVLARPNEYVPYDALLLDAVSSAKTVSKNLENVFKHKFLSERSVLALTVTKRCNVKYSNCYKDYKNLKRLVQKYSRKYNYQLTADSEQEQAKVISIIYYVKYPLSL